LEIVDGSNSPVATPSFGLTNKQFDFNASQNTTATLGTASQKLRLANPTAATSFSVSIAPAEGVTAWTGTTYTMPFKDLLTINPATCTIAKVDGKATDTSHISKGTSLTFSDSVTSIPLFNTSTDIGFSRYDITGISLTQLIPAKTQADTYGISLVLTEV
jgi:hypothetical protein